jgi:hypothetical protein
MQLQQQKTKKNKKTNLLIMDQAPQQTEKKAFSSKFYAGIVFLVAGGLFVLFNPFPGKPVELTPEEQEAELVEAFEGYKRRAIDGVLVPEEDLPKRLYGVMVENSAEAWPLSGISEARLVIEAPVEGNIPRLLAFYDETQNVEQIGPVRSARPYYISWAKGFDAMYTHVGGSPEGLAILRNSSLPSVNEFFWGNYFWRGRNRYAPHNVYTNIDLLTAVFEEREFEAQEIPAWEYKQFVEASGEPIEFVSIPFSSGSNLYTAKWEYDEEKKQFLRYQAGKKQEDTSKQSVYASNVVVVKTTVRTIDNEGRKSLITLGEGEGLLYRDGFEQEIIWKKQTDSSQLEFYTLDNEKAFLQPGMTWIEVIPSSTDIVVQFKGN